LILKSIGSLYLVRAIHHPIIDRKAIGERNAGAEAHVIKGQEVEPIGARVVNLILCVVSFDSQGTRPLPKVQVDVFSNWNYVRSVRLKTLR
jgi:hypothetical protein